MTKYMFRVLLGPNDKRTLEQTNKALDDWVDNHSDWRGDPTNHRVVTHDPPETELYWRGDYRFHTVDAKANLWQKLEDKLKDKHEWYRLGYHVCEHSGVPVGDCSWDEKREDGSVPSEIPDFDV